jgi:hypothetical protein
VGSQNAIFLPAPKTSRSSVLSADAGCLFAPTLMYWISIRSSQEVVGDMRRDSITSPEVNHRVGSGKITAKTRVLGNFLWL